jgi:hypothetical protein
MQIVLTPRMMQQLAPTLVRFQLGFAPTTGNRILPYVQVSSQLTSGSMCTQLILDLMPSDSRVDQNTHTYV